MRVGGNIVSENTFSIAFLAPGYMSIRCLDGPKHSLELLESPLKTPNPHDFHFFSD